MTKKHSSFRHPNPKGGVWRWMTPIFFNDHSLSSSKNKKRSFSYTPFLISSNSLVNFISSILGSCTQSYNFFFLSFSFHLGLFVWLSIITNNIWIWFCFDLFVRRFWMNPLFEILLLWLLYLIWVLFVENVINFNKFWWSCCCFLHLDFWGKV